MTKVILLLSLFSLVALNFGCKSDRSAKSEMQKEEAANTDVGDEMTEEDTEMMEDENLYDHSDDMRTPEEAASEDEKMEELGDESTDETSSAPY